MSPAVATDPVTSSSEHNTNISSSTRKRYTIVPPSVHREGNKKTIFANVADICKRMHRQPEHVIQFLFAELGTTGSVDGEKRLVIKGRFMPKQLENVLRRYIGQSQPSLLIVSVWCTDVMFLYPFFFSLGISGVRYLQDV